MVEDFNEPVGAAVSVPNTVKGVFRLIFDRVLIDHIVEETNRYARTVMESPGMRSGRRSRQMTFTPTSGS